VPETKIEMEDYCVMLEGEGMTDPELSFLLAHIMIIGGILTIVISSYMWYRQKKRIELMELEKVVKR